MSVRPERTGWRCPAISRWHRTKLDLNCPFDDIDQMLGSEPGDLGLEFSGVEFDRFEPVALLEYKANGAKPHNLLASAAGNRVMARLADRAGLPYLLAVYLEDMSAFRAIGYGRHGHELLPSWKTHTEYEWAELLYRIRGRPLPPHVAANLSRKPSGRFLYSRAPENQPSVA